MSIYFYIFLYTPIFIYIRLKSCLINSVNSMYICTYMYKCIKMRVTNLLTVTLEDIVSGNEHSPEGGACGRRHSRKARWRMWPQSISADPGRDISHENICMKAVSGLTAVARIHIYIYIYIYIYIHISILKSSFVRPGLSGLSGAFWGFLGLSSASKTRKNAVFSNKSGHFRDISGAFWGYRARKRCAGVRFRLP